MGEGGGRRYGYKNCNKRETCGMRIFCTLAVSMCLHGDKYHIVLQDVTKWETG